MVMGAGIMSACMHLCVYHTKIPQNCIQNMRFSLVEGCHCLCPVGECAWLNEPLCKGMQKTLTL